MSRLRRARLIQLGRSCLARPSPRPALSSRVAHENVVQLLGACARPPKLCFVMELCGSSVYHLLHLTRSPLTAQQKASILVRAAWGGRANVRC